MPRLSLTCLPDTPVSKTIMSFLQRIYFVFVPLSALISYPLNPTLAANATLPADDDAGLPFGMPVAIPYQLRFSERLTAVAGLPDCMGIMALKNTVAHVNYDGYPLRGVHPQLEDRKRFRLKKVVWTFSLVRCCIDGHPPYATVDAP